MNLICCFAVLSHVATTISAAGRYMRLLLGFPEGREAPHGRVEVEQGAEDVVGSPAERRVQPLVGHHHHVPAIRRLADHTFATNQTACSVYKFYDKYMNHVEFMRSNYRALK